MACSINWTMKPSDAIDNAMISAIFDELNNVLHKKIVIILRLTVVL